MKLPDWVLNGTTYEDIGKVSDYSMGWNFNTREKARLTGGLSRIDSFGENGGLRVGVSYLGKQGG